jgi:hypothetical protein
MANRSRRQSIEGTIADFLVSAPREVPILLLRSMLVVINKARRIRLFRVVLDGLQYFLKLLFMTLSPAVPRALKRRSGLRTLTRNAVILAGGTLFGFLISFPLNYFGSWLAGTLRGANPSILYFAQDSHNIDIYLRWAPLYMGFSTCVIVLTAMYWNDLRGLADRYRNVEFKYDDHARALAAVVIMALISAFFAQRYAYGLLLAPRTEAGQLYWFVSEYSGKVGYNAASPFYLGAIYFKLLFLFIALACYISIAIEWTRLVHGLAKQKEIEEAERSRILRGIIACDWIYLSFQGLFIALIFHNFVWGKSDIGKHGLNEYLTIVFLALCFVFFMSLPRTYTNIEYNRSPAKYHFILARPKTNSEARFLSWAIRLAYGMIYGSLALRIIEKIVGKTVHQMLDIVWEFIVSIAARMGFAL